PPGSALTPDQQSAIEGKANPGFCTVWVNSFVPAYDPTRVQNCGAGFPASLVYDPAARPEGVRCDLLDPNVASLGSFVDVDGHRKAVRLYDNQGVQYGLSALQDGVISPQEFVDLNEGIGSYSTDLIWSGPGAPGAPAARVSSTPAGLDAAY